MQPRSGSSTHARWLWLLLAVFVVRVIAQPLALVVNASYLPPFAAWHSGVVPYWMLAGSQLAIVALLVLLTRGVSSGAVMPRRAIGFAVLAAGSVYFSVMFARVVLGATLLSDHSWFARPLPTVFHLVLASFLLVYGHFHYRDAITR